PRLSAPGASDQLAFPLALPKHLFSRLPNSLTRGYPPQWSRFLPSTSTGKRHLSLVPGVAHVPVHPFAQSAASASATAATPRLFPPLLPLLPLSCSVCAATSVVYSACSFLPASPTTTLPPLNSPLGAPLRTKWMGPEAPARRYPGPPAIALP